MRLATIMVATILGACGGGQGLELTRIDSSVQKPSNVAVYFTVDTREGEPVAGLTADAFKIYEDGKLVSVHESQQTILNPEIAAEHYTLLLVDMSGSVVESGDVHRIVHAAKSFTERVGQYQKVGVYAFDGREDVVPITGFTSSGGRVDSSIDTLNSYEPKDPSTNLNGAVIKALKELDKQMGRAKAPLRFGTLVIFTDGTDRAARVDRKELHEILDEADYDIFVIGVGAEIDEDELEQIGRSGVVLSKDSEDVNQSFEKVAKRIEDMSKRYYLLGYCSPSRAGSHKVRIEANAEGQSGSLEYEFDAKGFGADCDPEKPPRFNIKRPRPVQADSEDTSRRGRR